MFYSSEDEFLRTDRAGVVEKLSLDCMVTSCKFRGTALCVQSLLIKE